MLASLAAFARPFTTSPDPYGDSYYSDTTMEPAAVAGLITLMIFLYLLIFAVAFVISGLVWAGAFSKAGHAKWKAYVPFYSMWILVKISGRPESHFWLLFIPYFNIYMQIVILNDIAKSFGKDAAFTVGLVFLPVVFAAILSYGDARYLGPSYLTPAQKQSAQQYAQQQYGQQFAPQQFTQPYGQQPYPGQPQAFDQPPAQPNAQQNPDQYPYGSGPPQQP
ncbi:hypothetical protein SAMN04489740_3397 [Arthrobacter alpinus]|uniref:Signal peptidase I n=1 Tax=Arthrobacter alpinus TaxID=656366 RepID=A0A1H5N802_9MICC|nr:DUF5684 domain-containing protein [Arthrobacter alpinus]SEE96798.1 hypothetical protein SAMN04489740_3397 [Arthrobacter alpinus]